MWRGDPALTPWLNRPLCILHNLKFIFVCGKNASGKPANQSKHRNECLSNSQQDFFLHMKVKYASSKPLRWAKDALRWKVYCLSDFMAQIKVRKREKTELGHMLIVTCWICNEMTRQDELSVYQSSVSVVVDLSGFYKPVKASYNQTLPKPVRNKW